MHVEKNNFTVPLASFFKQTVIHLLLPLRSPPLLPISLFDLCKQGSCRDLFLFPLAFFLSLSVSKSIQNCRTVQHENVQGEVQQFQTQTIKQLLCFVLFFLLLQHSSLINFTRHFNCTETAFQKKKQQQKKE